MDHLQSTQLDVDGDRNIFFLIKTIQRKLVKYFSKGAQWVGLVLYFAN